VDTTKWPDLSAHDRAFTEAKRELGEHAPVRDLLRRAELLLRKVPKHTSKGE